MHRQTTTFSSRMNRVFTHRANRVSKAIERQGIRATYELHDRLLSNRSARERFASSPPRLDDAQRGILAEVQQQGFAVRSFDQLFSSGEWQGIAEQRDRFVSATEADLAAGGEHVRVRPGKEFVVRLQSYGVELGPDDPWFRTVSSRRLLDLANTYVGMWSKLEYVDVWYSVPQPQAGERISSQRWHRDYNDKHLLKVFLYLVDVDENMGPFQYVAGSQPGGPYAEAWGWQPLGQQLPDRGGARGPHPPRRGRTFTGPAGTLLFCNTAGFHRGGFSTTKPRVLATATYSSPASLAALTVRSYSYTGRCRRARRAVTLCSHLTVPVEQRPDDTAPLARERAARRVALRSGSWTWNDTASCTETWWWSFGESIEQTAASTLTSPSFSRFPGIQAVAT